MDRTALKREEDLLFSSLSTNNDEAGSKSKNDIIEISGQPKWMVEVIEILSRRWNEFPSLEYLSSEVGVHPITISKHFSKMNGITLSQYMRFVKVRKATGLLRSSNNSLTKIAYECGFSDQSHMGRLIKQHFGVSPSIIRRNSNFENQ